MEMQPDPQPRRAPVQHGLVPIIDGATKALQEAITAQKLEKLVTAKRHRKSLEVKDEVLRCNQRRHKREVKRLRRTSTGRPSATSSSSCRSGSSIATSTASRRRWMA